MIWKQITVRKYCVKELEAWAWTRLSQWSQYLIQGQAVCVEISDRNFNNKVQKVYQRGFQPISTTVVRYQNNPVVSEALKVPSLENGRLGAVEY